MNYMDIMPKAYTARLCYFYFFKIFARYERGEHFLSKIPIKLSHYSILLIGERSCCDTNSITSRSIEYECNDTKVVILSQEQHNKNPYTAEHGLAKKQREMHLKFPIRDFRYSAATIKKMAPLCSSVLHENKHTKYVSVKSA